MLPKRRCDFDPPPMDEYERVSVRDIQLLDPAPAVIVAPEPTSLSPMAVELEETVIALTRRPTPPTSARPSVAAIATIFSMSTMMSLTAMLILRGGEVPDAHVAAAGLVAPQASPAAPALPASEPSPVVPASEPEAEAIAIAIPVTSLPTAPVPAAPVPVRRRALAAAVPPAAPAAAQTEARRKEPAIVPSHEPATSEPASNDAAQPAEPAEPAQEPTDNAP